MRAIDTWSSETLPDILRAHEAVLFVNGSVARLGAVNHAAITLVQSCAPDTVLYDVSRNRGVRREVMQTSFWDSFPQLFVNGEFIGGYQVLEEFFRSGEYSRTRRHTAKDHSLFDWAGAGQASSSLWRMDYDRGSGLLATASASGCIEVVNPLQSQRIRRIRIADGWVNAVAILDGGERVAAGLTDGTIRLVEPSTGRAVGTFKGHDRWVNDLACGPDGLLFSVSADRRLAAWSTGTGELVASVIAHDSCIWCVAANASGTTVATGAAAGDVKLWRIHGLEPMHGATIDERCVTDLCWFGPNVLAATYSGDVLVLNADLSEAGRLVGHRERVWTITPLADFDRCASASGDGTVRLWDLGTGRELARTGFESMPISTAYVASLNALAVGDDKGAITWLEVGDASLTPLPGW